MAAYFSQFNGVEIFFLVCAIVGGAFVGLRFVMLLFGLHDGDGGDGTVSGPDVDGHHADSDVGFKLLSLQGITSFLMMPGPPQRY